MIWRSPHCRHWSGTWCRTSSPTICLPAFLLSSHGSPSSYPLTLYQVTLAIVVVIIIIITIIMMMMIISISIMIKFAKLIAGRMSLLITLFLVLVNIFNNVTTNSPKVKILPTHQRYKKTHKRQKKDLQISYWSVWSFDFWLEGHKYKTKTNTKTMAMAKKRKVMP